jgi:hypothetical protein
MGTRIVERTGLSLPAPNASPWTESYAYDTSKRLTNVHSVHVDNPMYTYGGGNNPDKCYCEKVSKLAK